MSSTEEQVVTQSCLVRPAISADGRFVAFHSDAAGLVLNDTSTNSDIFVRDRELGTTERVSVGSNGETALGNGTEYANSLDPAISADGRFVAFMSSGRNLIAGREIHETHVYVRDRVTGTTEIVSERPDGQPTNGPAAQPSLSADGRYVAFVSYSEGLVPGDDNLGPDVFVRDRIGGTTRMASVTATGEPAAGGSSERPSISADGRSVAFHSDAGNLSPGGGFGTIDIILFDAASGVTKPLTIGRDGGDNSIFPSLTANGSQVAFASLDSDLVPNDTNGVIDVFRATITSGDDVPPVLTLPRSPVVVPADRPDGAVVTYEVTATDTVDPNPTVSCSPPSGSVFPIGDTAVTCTATDASGNVAKGSFSVHVQGVDEQLDQLQHIVDTFDMDEELRADLHDKLAAAEAALAAHRTRTACNLLRGFANEVQDESGAGITADLAGVLIERADRIRSVLACA